MREPRYGSVVTISRWRAVARAHWGWRCGLLAVFTGNGAHAESAVTVAIPLTYEAPSECPRKEAVLTRIALRVQHSPPTANAATAIISRQSSGYRLELNVEGGQRHIESASCESLVQTLAVILALSLDAEAQRAVTRAPVAVADGGSVEPNVSGAAAVVTEVPLPLPTTPPAVIPAAVIASPKPNPPRIAPKASATDRFTDDRWGLSAGLWGEVGMLPGPSAGPSIGFFWEAGSWSYGAAAKWLAPRWAQAPGTDAHRGGRISFLGGQVHGCWAVGKSRRYAACGGLEAGDLMGQGVSVSDERLGHGFWLAGTGAGAMRVPVGASQRLEFRLAAAVPVFRPEFGFTGNDWRIAPKPWSLRLEVGILWP